MPFLDGTGPWGQGPMTGRGMGYCAGYVRPGYGAAAGRGLVGRGRGFGGGRGWGMGLGFRRGWGAGRGQGWGRGMGRGAWGVPPWGIDPVYAGTPYYAPQMSREEEIDFLREEANAVKSQLGEIESRIKDLETEQE